MVINYVSIVMKKITSLNILILSLVLFSLLSSSIVAQTKVGPFWLHFDIAASAANADCGALRFYRDARIVGALGKYR